MGFDAPDRDIIDLLTKLKGAESEYPQHLLAAQRQRYLRRMAEVSVGIGAGIEVQSAVKPAASSTTSAVASKLVETALVLAIVVEAGAAAYVHRKKLSDLVQNVFRSAEVQEIFSPSVMTTPVTTAILNPEHTLTVSVGNTATPILPTVSASPPELGVFPTLTPIPALAGETLPAGATATQVEINETPSPDEENGDNGNHYGQTPKPERTKDNNGNDDKPPREDNGEPPKDNGGPPQKDPKPTKSK